MKNYLLGLFCVVFLFACGGDEDTVAESSSVADSSADTSYGSAFMKEFKSSYMDSCAVEGETQGLTAMFAMLGVDYVDYCQCTLDAALEGETESTLSDSTAESRLMMKVLNSAEACMAKYMPY